MAYHCKQADGTRKTWRDSLPADFHEMEPDRCEVEYVEKDGWECDISGCRKWEDLPAKARDYVLFVEQDLGVPIEWIGVGAERNAMIMRA